MLKILRVFVASTLLTLIPIVHAQESSLTREYWVSIASFQEFENAEIAQKQASERITERLTIAPATIPSGYVLRVVAGPYFDRSRAEQVLETSRLAGYDSAWIFTQEVPALATAYVSEGIEASDTYNFPDSTPVLRSDFVPPPADPARNQPTLVDQAPANYSVHRLHRN